jgi:hypothetical protein
MEIHLFKATQRRPMCQQELGLRPNFIRDLRPAKAEEVNVAAGFSPARQASTAAATAADASLACASVPLRIVMGCSPAAPILLLTVLQQETIPFPRASEFVLYWVQWQPPEKLWSRFSLSLRCSV